MKKPLLLSQRIVLFTSLACLLTTGISLPGKANILRDSNKATAKKQTGTLNGKVVDEKASRCQVPAFLLRN